MIIKRFISSGYCENCYIVYDDTKEALIVDPGANADKILKTIKENNLKVKAIFQTHSHFDHIMAAEELSVALDLPVTLNIEEKEVLEKYLNVFDVKVTIPKKLVYVNNMDIVKIGNMSFEVINTPGHTKGSCCLYCENVLFSGDTLFKETYGRYDLPTGSYEEIKNSLLEIIFKLKNEVKVYPGHGFSTTIGHEKQNNGIFQ